MEHCGARASAKLEAELDIAQGLGDIELQDNPLRLSTRPSFSFSARADES